MRYAAIYTKWKWLRSALTLHYSSSLRYHPPSNVTHQVKEPPLCPLEAELGLNVILTHLKGDSYTLPREDIRVQKSCHTLAHSSCAFPSCRSWLPPTLQRHHWLLMASTMLWTLDLWSRKFIIPRQGLINLWWHLFLRYGGSASGFLENPG